MIADCTAIILAGGDSQRMGSDKANLLLGGRSLLQRVTATMQQVFPKVMLSVREPRTGIELPQVCDDPSCAGPLAGLLSGFTRVDTPWVFAVACDMPFVVPEVVELLAQRRAGFQVVVPIVREYPQPLAAFYARSCLDVMRAHLESGGKNSLRAVLEKLDVCYVDEAEILAADPGLRSFFDLDTPQDVARARREREMG
ncbi:MAG: molybdenum cofactor guanylyltransferase [Nitrosomonadales bacterium]|nr:molybdenum cofactor guanylyltransferase [Nitrosomonadales bacterium]